jgi:hypothetical protein
MRPYLKRKHYNKKAGRVAQGVGPEFRPQYRKKKKKICLFLQKHKISPFWGLASPSTSNAFHYNQLYLFIYLFIDGTGV